MNALEQSIEQHPKEFETLIDEAASEVSQAMEELSTKLDTIFGKCLVQHCIAHEIDVPSSAKLGPDYKRMNQIICGRLDQLIGEHIARKRADI